MPKLLPNKEFEIAWNSLKAVIHNCVGLHRPEDWQILIENMFASCEGIVINLPLKIHFLHYDKDYFGRIIPTKSGEHGERFHQAAAPLEHWYSLLADLY